MGITCLRCGDEWFRLAPCIGFADCGWLRQARPAPLNVASMASFSLPGQDGWCYHLQMARNSICIWRGFKAGPASAHCDCCRLGSTRPGPLRPLTRQAHRCPGLACAGVVPGKPEQQFAVEAGTSTGKSYVGLPSRSVAPVPACADLMQIALTSITYGVTAPRNACFSRHRLQASEISGVSGERL